MMDVKGGKPGSEYTIYCLAGTTIDAYKLYLLNINILDVVKSGMCG